MAKRPKGTEESDNDMVLGEPEQVFDFTQRNTQLKNIIGLTFFLIKTFEGKDVQKEMEEKVIDIDRSNTYAGILSTVYSYLRKMNNPNESARGNTHGDQSCVLGQVVYSVKWIVAEYEKAVKHDPWDFKIATPLVDCLCAFKMVWDEARLSASKFRLKVGPSKIVEKSISAFGLSNVHLPHLNGLTFKPERRAGLMRTMGALTLCIQLAAEQRMHGKIADALRESLKMLPMCDSIIEVLRNAKGPEDVRSIFSTLGDLLLVLGTRSSNKIYYPLLFFVKTAEKATFQLDFSGLRGMVHYVRYVGEYIWMKKSKGLPEDIAQTIFHGMFGTAIEDMGVLAQITNCTSWKTRSELNDAFINKESSPKMFTPIKFLYVTKLASASMIKGGMSTQSMLLGRTIFAGARKRTYNGKLLTYLESGARQITYGNDVSSISSALVRYKENLVKKIQAGGLTDLGTTKWYNFADGTEVNIEIRETGKFFYS